MPTLASLGGNWSTNTTWAVCNATAENDSEAANTTLTTSYVSSTTFTPGAVTVDGIMVKIATRQGTTGTITVALDQAGSDVAGTVVAINVSDLDAGIGGWVCFKFTGVALAGATAYSVKAKTSSSSQVNLYSLATTNWARQLRTTATSAAAPVAGDKIIIVNEKTGANAQNAITETLDGDQSGVSLGSTAFPQSVHVASGGTLTFSTGAAANPKIKWVGVFGVYGGATLNCGTSITPIPSGSTADFAMASAANVDSGLVFNNGSTVNIYGLAKTTLATLMTADKAIASTVITLAATTNWAVSDVLAFASTTRTVGDCESKIILTVDSATQVTLTAGLAAAHSGTSPTQAEVINLTRNVKFHGASASLQGYVVCAATAVVNIQYAEFTQLGSATASKRGIDVATTTGTFIFKFNAVHDSTVVSSLGILTSGASGQTAATFIVSSNVFYNLYNVFLQIAATSGTWVVDSNVGILNTAVAAAAIYSLNDVGGTFTNNTAVGGTTGISANESGVIVSWSGNTAHSNSGSGLLLTGVGASTLSSPTLWRNGGTGFNTAATTASIKSLTIDGLVLFGNTTQNMALSGVADLLFTNAVISADTTFATATGVLINSADGNVTFESCTFGVVSGIKAAHTQDFNMSLGPANIVLRNCVLASATEVLSWAAATTFRNAFVLSAKHDQQAGNQKFWLQYGIGSIDTVIFNTASPSLRLTPNTAGSKLESAPPGGYGATCGVASGGVVTGSVWIRRSISTDSGGFNYAGNAPTVVLRKNVAIGIAADTIVGTSSGSNGAWELVTFTTTPATTDRGACEFIVNCDGSSGAWLNVGEWSFSPVLDTKNGSVYMDGVPVVSGDNGGISRSRSQSE